MLDDEEEPNDAQAVLVAASAAGQMAAGPRAGGSVRRLGELHDDGGAMPPGRAAQWEGYSLNASTTVREDRGDALERLCRYLLRPPLAKGRLEERPDGKLVWSLRRPWSDGTEAFVYSALELTEKRAAFIVPPRVHLILYHGVFASNGAKRGDVVDVERNAARRAEQEEARSAALLRKRDRRKRRRVRIAGD